MNRFLLFMATVVTLVSVPTIASARSCGAEGQEPCGGQCEYDYVFCPLCIPYCKSRIYTCNEGLDVVQVSYYTDGLFTDYKVCQKPPAPSVKPVSVDQAIKAGCRTAAENTATVNDALSRTTLGTKTREKLSAFSKGDGWATRQYVTDPETRGYRAATIRNEEAALMAGRLTTKAERFSSGLSGPELTEFWQANGPQLAANQQDNLSLALQMLSTSSSDEPRSQSTSVALSFDVASGFGNVIYHFRLNPQSPVLGMSQCKTTGEVQIQPPGGTPIRDLRRYDRTKKYWEKYKAGVWYRMDKDEL
ncbi:hypothetical protein [Corallococcus terminator]|uniref:Uncharacterized protein n=1 Tax=Corallococcus terminator TaxID=2316733 RepID=A0A3A8IAE5_9BACT|nr:hypothetical protein [Corallococcus terminator]RKG80457.1 hypothetical protein D7V88_27450 [Corallococcus terminator]